MKKSRQLTTRLKITLYHYDKHIPVSITIPENVATDDSVNESDCKATSVLPLTFTPTGKQVKR